MHDIHSDKILILDFGSQYTQLIARRVREAGVYCEIHHTGISDQEIKDFNPKGIILSGGPESVTADDRPDPRVDRRIQRTNWHLAKKNNWQRGGHHRNLGAYQ